MNKTIRRFGIAGVAALAMLLASGSTAFAANQVYPLAFATQDWGCGTESRSSTVHLVLQCDGNLVLYRNSDNHAMWAAGTDVLPQAPSTLGFSSRGMLWLHAGDSTACVIVKNVYGGRAVVQDDGNFVVYRADGTAAWSSGTYNNRQGTVHECA
ncbi:hypothetical protein [Streptomyces sp. WM6372]|uniref:hypothetical protein n=1 Tax=Streptomyces sp. WM6372 TaxID=1415555 RepID=UPI000B1D5677|nr:hypothetical protein [Streptomyces sp. WM6372]